MDRIKKSFDKTLLKELENNYDKHNKEEFKEITSSLKLPKETLMKYTSTIEKCSLEYKNCKNCKSLLECKNKIAGFKYTPIYDKELNFSYIICKYKDELDKIKEYQNNIYYNAIPERIMNANINDLYLDYKERFQTIEWLKKFINNYLKDNNQKGLYLNGNFGCGKTFLISATFNELAKKGIKSAIIFWPEYLRDLKASFQTDFNSKYEVVKNMPLLLIDDIGAENITDWARDEVFCPLVQYRMENNLTTFFTSNLTLEELESHFAKTRTKDEPVKARRIIERIKQLTINMEMISKNLRS